MTLTVNVPDEYAAFLPAKEAELAQVLSAGLRHWHSHQSGEIQDLADVAEILANLPSPDEVLAMRPSAALSERTSALLEKNRSEGLSVGEQSEWAEIMQVEHLVRIAKARAVAKLKASDLAA